MAFHVQDGLFFARNDDGSITVSVGGLMEGSALLFKTTFPPSSFASVVASMSVRGETSATWQEACDYLSRAPKGQEDARFTSANMPTTPCYTDHRAIKEHHPSYAYCPACGEKL